MTREVEVTEVGHHYDIRIGPDLIITINKEEKESLAGQLDDITEITFSDRLSDLVDLLNVTTEAKANFDSTKTDFDLTYHALKTELESLVSSSP